MEDIRKYSEDHDEPGAEHVSLLKQGRSDSISFDHASFIPLSSSAEERRPSLTHTKIGIIEGIALVVGLQIGGGIFSSPVGDHLPSYPASSGASPRVILKRDLMSLPGSHNQGVRQCRHVASCSLRSGNTFICGRI